MHHLLKHRNYERHEKWGVFAALAIVTLAVWSTQSLWLQQAPASASTLFVQNISVPSTVSMIDAKSGNEAVIAVVDKRTNKPAKDIWVGLRVSDDSMRSSDYTYYDWYSPEPNRAFYQTNELGLIYFPLKSTLLGKVDYDIYVANPDIKTAAKYQKLPSGFSVEYK